MHLPRFRLRTLMILVAVCATTIEAYRLKRLSDRHGSKAEVMQITETLYNNFQDISIRSAKEFRELAKNEQRKAEQPGVPDDVREVHEDLRLENERGVTEMKTEADKCAKRAAYYKHLRLKYTRAARYPWLPVPPDPPEPE